MARDHRTAELRSIEMHRLVAERLDDGILETAGTRVERWIADGAPVHRAAALRWRALLQDPELASRLVEDSEEMRDLRQNTPFAGELTDQERWRVIEEIG